MRINQTIGLTLFLNKQITSLLATKNWSNLLQDQNYTTSIKFLIKNINYLKYDVKLFLNSFVDIAGVNFPSNPLPFGLKYVLQSQIYASLMVLESSVQNLSLVPSINDYFPGASWSQREVWDMFGVYFTSKDQQRILTDYGFMGHPLNKSFPLSGFAEIYFSLSQNTLTPVKCKLNLVLKNPCVILYSEKNRKTYITRVEIVAGDGQFFEVQVQEACPFRFVTPGIVSIRDITGRYRPDVFFPHPGIFVILPKEKPEKP